MLRIEETRIAGGTLGGAFRLKNKTPALPGFCQIWSGKRDSNSRPRPWQGRALPTELFPRRKRNSTFKFGTVNWNSFPGAQNRPRRETIHKAVPKREQHGRHQQPRAAGDKPDAKQTTKTQPR